MIYEPNGSLKKTQRNFEKKSKFHIHLYLKQAKFDMILQKYFKSNKIQLKI